MSTSQSTIVRRELDSPLLAYSSNVTSQCGEDGIIAHLVEVIEPVNRYCIEFGAWDGKHYSNCYDLLTNKGWRGLMIEANAERYKQLERTYANNDRVTTLRCLVDFEGPNALDNLLGNAGAPKEPGVLSIDVDGNDYYIFESLNHYRPELIVIEFNPTIPNDVFFVQDKSFEVNQGCSLLALIFLGKRKGYELAAATDCNALFVRADKFPALGISDNSIGALYAPLQDGRIFQGYDGTIHVVGMDRLLWWGRAVSSADFQIVPEAKRVWGDAQKK